MALILAVEPNGRQAAYLASVLRARPRTELVIAESAVYALEALGARVPDVLLTSALLSPHDEATLGNWLRGLGSAAAHVQELTIPVLATTEVEEKPQRRGVMSALWRRREKPATPDGCRPDDFAEQVSTYVAHAGERKVVQPEAAVATEPAADAAPAARTTMSVASDIPE